MPAESTAVASDLTRVLFPNRLEIIRVIDQTFDRICGQWARFQPEVREAFEPVRSAMSAVRQAADHDVLIYTAEEHERRMRTAIERLRESCCKAALGELPPCLLSWSSAR